MNWNSSEFIWLDWAVLAVGVILIAWAVYRAIQKDKKLQQGANSEDYLFGKGEPWYIIGEPTVKITFLVRVNPGTLSVRLFLLQISVQNILSVWQVQVQKTVSAWHTGKCKDG